MKIEFHVLFALLCRSCCSPPQPQPASSSQPLPIFAFFFFVLPTGATLLLPPPLPPTPPRHETTPTQAPRRCPSRRAYPNPSPLPLPPLRMLPARSMRPRCPRPPTPTRRLPSPPEPSPPLTRLPPPRVSGWTAPCPRRKTRLLSTVTATAALNLRPELGSGRQSWYRCVCLCVVVVAEAGFRVSGVRALLRTLMIRLPQGNPSSSCTWRAESY